MNKVIYVKSSFKRTYEVVSKEVKTGEVKRGMFGGEKPVVKNVLERVESGFQEGKIDGEKLAKDVEQAINELNREGYEVVSMSDLTSGHFDVNSNCEMGVNGGFGWGWGYGYSYTEGVTIIAKKIASY